MNRGSARSLLCLGVSFLVACGARTSTLEDEEFGEIPAEGGTSSAGTSGVVRGGRGGTTSAAGRSGAAGAQSGFGGSGAFAATGAVSSGGVSSGGVSSGGVSSGGVSSGGVSSGGVSGGVTGGEAGAAGAFGGAAGSGGAIVSACEALLASECAPCLCKTCAPALIDCFSDLGCAVIFSCAESTNCVGFDCYRPKTCRSVIDQFGGPAGPSARRVFSLAACSVTSQNSCGCN